LIHGVTNETSDNVLKRADTAMYQAKKVGGKRFSFFDPELQRLVDLHLQIERDIEEAIEQGQFTAHFQPQLGSDGALVGAEALIRWTHPTRGMIGPDEFIPIAEQSGAIHRLQKIVLIESCKFMMQVREAQLQPESCFMAINVSACQLENDMEQSLFEIIDSFGIPPEKFKLEITESMLMRNVESIVSQMLRLKNKGFRFSIDDFGTGYSSLSYLHTFPIDELKIDRSFVGQISEKGTAIIDAIISISESFGFKVVAEGVENQEQVDVIKQKDVQSMQGYFFARPMPAQEFIDWLKSRVTP